MAPSVPPPHEDHAVLREGLLVADKYRLVEQLGTGAMGAVWSATHLTLGHAVALKFLHGSVMSSEDARQRFDREARLAARLGEASRHITRVIDHGVHEDDKPYLVMELLRGEGLATILRRQPYMSLQHAALIVQHLARALHVTHSAGVIHRDLKPANIFLCHSEDGDEVFVKLLDFGIAKATRDTDDEPTGAGMLLGTPSYMSPEQVMGDAAIDVRSDLWAVAAIVYRMTCGRPPFGGGEMTELGLRILSTEPTAPSEIVPDLPIELDMWMKRGLAKKADERFQTARELSDFLARVAHLPTSTKTPTSRPPSSSPHSDRFVEIVLETTANETPIALASAPPKSASVPPLPLRKSALPVALVLGLAVVVGATAIGTRLGRSERAATAVSNESKAVASTASPEAVHAEAAPSTIPSQRSSPIVQVESTASPTPAGIAPLPPTFGRFPIAGAASLMPATSTKKPDISGWDNKKEL